MAEVYASLVINNKKTFLNVPSDQKEKVKEILIGKGREDLIVE